MYCLRAYHTPSTLTSNPGAPRPIAVPKVILSDFERLDPVWLEAPVFEVWVGVGSVVVCVFEASWVDIGGWAFSVENVPVSEGK
jgi:hypothetical protein